MMRAERSFKESERRVGLTDDANTFSTYDPDLISYLDSGEIPILIAED